MVLSNSLAVIHVFLLLFIRGKNTHFLEMCVIKDERKISVLDVGSCDQLEEERQVVYFLGIHSERPGLWA